MAKPLIWAGNGLRLDGKADTFRAIIDKHWIPFVTTWTGQDLLPTDHPMNVGVVGVSGHPGANKAVHEASHLYVMGSGFHPTQTGIKAPEPIRDWDYLEEPDLDWLQRCESLKAEKVPLVGSYLFNDKMTRMLPPGCVMVIDGGGTALYTGFQSSHIKKGSRIVCSTAISAMGSGLPEALGACLASPGRLTTCLIGDGSLMFNLSTLATIKNLDLPIKVFVLSNKGYLAIRHSQDGFLEGRYHGTEPKDLGLQNIKLLALAFGIPYLKIPEPYDEELIGSALDLDGPVLCEVITPEDQKMVRAVMGKSLSEMVF